MRTKQNVGLPAGEATEQPETHPSHTRKHFVGGAAGCPAEDFRRTRCCYNDQAHADATHYLRHAAADSRQEHPTRHLADGQPTTKYQLPQYYVDTSE